MSLFKNSSFGRTQTPYVLFFICIVFYLVFLYLTQPYLMTSGEMWAEMATNYFVNANADSFFKQLFAVDSGYIPLPQRLIALLFGFLKIKASLIPYFYTWTGALASALLVGVFCLREFRLLIRNDFFRFIISLGILVVSDFETRTFVNFTYDGAFFCAITTALFFVKREARLPFWVWFVPILLLSKPAVLCSLPLMILVAFVRGQRVRALFGLAVVFGAIQILTLLQNHSQGVFAVAADVTVFDKLNAVLSYFFGFLGLYALMWLQPYGSDIKIDLGVVVFIGLIFIVFRKPKSRGILIICGLSLLFFNLFLNAFAITDLWNKGMDRLDSTPIFRQAIVGVFGVFLAVVGAIETVIGNKKMAWGRLSVPVCVPIFLTWFFFSGWLDFAILANREPVWPMIHNGAWQAGAAAVDRQKSICLPIDPYGWVYRYHCKELTPFLSLYQGLGYGLMNGSLNQSIPYSIPIPPEVYGKSLTSVAISIRSIPHQPSRVVGTLKLLAGNRVEQVLTGQRLIPESGGQIFLTGSAPILVGNGLSASLEFNAPVALGTAMDGDVRKSLIVWMGNEI